MKQIRQVSRQHWQCIPNMQRLWQCDHMYLFWLRLQQLSQASILQLQQLIAKFHHRHVSRSAILQKSSTYELRPVGLGIPRLQTVPLGFLGFENWVSYASATICYQHWVHSSIWLNNKYDMQTNADHLCCSEFEKSLLLQVAQSYLRHLLAENKFEEAASQCPRLLKVKFNFLTNTSNQDSNIFASLSCIKSAISCMAKFMVWTICVTLITVKGISSTGPIGPEL